MWTQRDHKFGIIQGLAYGNEMFVATIIDGKVLRSTDGIAWTPAGDSGAGSHTRVVFGNGQFAASGDPGNTVTSIDGLKWQPFATANVTAFCDGKLQSKATCWQGRFFAGFWTPDGWLREDGGAIQTSSDGHNWKTVFPLPGNGVEDIVMGWVAPAL